MAFLIRAIWGVIVSLGLICCDGERNATPIAPTERSDVAVVPPKQGAEPVQTAVEPVAEKENAEPAEAATTEGATPAGGAVAKTAKEPTTAQTTDRIPTKKQKAAGGEASKKRAKTQLTGCLAEDPSKQDGEKNAKRRVPSVNFAQIDKREDHIVVRHNLTHLCCLRAEVKTKITDKTIRINEKLTGDNCRCRCTSIIKTTVPLEPDTYHVIVELDDRGTKTVVHDQKVTLK